MLPMVKQMTQMKMLNQTGLILLHLTFSLSTGLFLFVNYIRSLPTEIEEAARVDGCNVFQTYIRIVIHLIKPMVATIIVMDSLGCWNNFMMALLILNKIIICGRYLLCSTILKQSTALITQWLLHHILFA